jgi:hypothetical protein
MPLVFYTFDPGDDVWFGNVYVGRLLLTEYFDATDALNSGGSSEMSRQLTITGQESWPPLAGLEDVRYRGEQIMAMNNMIVPVVFASKTDRNGYYLVSSPEVDWHHYGGVASSFEWTIVLERYGTEAEVMIESRLIGGVRTSYYPGNVAEKWHSPGSGSIGYYAGSTVPTSMSRSGSEGSITVYRGLAPTASARWGAAPQDYLDGSSRITVAGDVMCGLTLQNHPTNWTLENTLIRIAPISDSGTFTLSYYDGAGFIASCDWDINVGSTLLTDPSYVTILRNDPEECILRISYITVAGYSTVDVALRRGARFANITVQHQDSQTFHVGPALATAATNSGNGYIYQTSNDSDGNRFTSGSAVQIDANTLTGQISNHTAQTFFSFWIAIEYGGSGAAAGDTAANVAGQYLGLSAEDTRVISR